MLTMKEGGKMAQYHKFDLENWPRREHYRYYTECLKIEFNLTVPVDVKHMLEVCHKKGYRFYPAMIALITQIMNETENFRMCRGKEGELCVWDEIVPNYTIFHEDDQTFSDCWSAYTPDFDALYHGIVEDMEKYGNKKGIKAREGQPANFYCVSCVPWVSFTGCSSRLTDSGEPAFFPVITMGKYQEEQGKMMMPVNLNIAHAVCDGYHASMFFQRLQERLHQFS